ncbi:MAG: 5'-nucleotidase C-terminal domain-containing protein, partial [Terrimicrobiaceae bacterium]
KILASPAGTINAQLSVKGSGPGQPGEVQRLIGTAILAALAGRGCQADAVLHGSFSEEDLTAGEKTVGDIWGVIPYENFVITGDLTPGEITTAMGDVYWGPGKTGLQLMGIQVKLAEGPRTKRIEGLADKDGQPLDSARRYRIAMNTFDASSAGQRLMKLRAIMESPSANATIHPVQTREALIEFLTACGKSGVGLSDLAV